QEPHPAGQGLLGEVLLTAREPRLPGLRHRLGQGRRLHLLRPALPRGLAGAGPQRRPAGVQPVGHQPRALVVPVEARAAGLRGRQRVLHRRDQPHRHRGPRRQRLLRVELLRRPGGQVRRRRGRRAQPGADRARPGLRTAGDGARPLAVLPGPPSGRLRRPHPPVIPTGDHTVMALLIKGGTVVGPAGAQAADVLVDGETIAAVFAPGRGPSDVETLDATGKYVIPGGVDAHTHMELPFGGTFASDTFETGTRAAAYGGTTTIIDFAVQRTGEVVQDGLAAWH